MTERDFQTRFSKWLRYVHKRTGCFELKVAKGDSIPFSAVVPHQKEALIQAKHDVISYKIPDMGTRNPFDCFSLAGVEAFVVVKYPDFFCLIDIDGWCEEEEQSKRRSLTSKRAREIASLIY